MSDPQASEQTRGYGRSAAQLTLALGVAGVLTYAFFAVASRSLDRDQYGEIVVLWSLAFLLTSTLFRPIEQLLARTIAERDQAGVAYDDALRSAAKLQAGLCALAVVGLLIARVPLEEHLFSSSSVLYWALVGAVVGFALAFYARGFLAGRGQFPHYAALVLLEVLLRLSFAAIVAIGIAEGEDLIAIGIAAAPLASLIVLPLALRRPHPHRDLGNPAQVPGTRELSLGRGGAFAGAVLLMMLSEQVLVSSGALFVRAAEGAAAAGYIFNVLMVARAPLVLFQAIAASLLPHLTRLRARGDQSGRDAFRSSLSNTIILIVAFASLTTLGVVAIGPEVMQLAFGDKFDYDRLGLAIVAVGMGFYLVAASLNQAVLAQGQAHRAAARWVLCSLVFIAINLIGIVDAFRSVEIGFAVSAALLSALLYAIYANPHPSVADSFEPGSAQELQARLASSDEVA